MNNTINTVETIETDVISNISSPNLDSISISNASILSLQYTLDNVSSFSNMTPLQTILNNTLNNTLDEPNIDLESKLINYTLDSMINETDLSGNMFNNNNNNNNIIENNIPSIKTNIDFATNIINAVYDVDAILTDASKSIEPVAPIITIDQSISVNKTNNTDIAISIPVANISKYNIIKKTNNIYNMDTMDNINNMDTMDIMDTMDNMDTVDNMDNIKTMDTVDNINNTKDESIIKSNISLAGVSSNINLNVLSDNAEKHQVSFSSADVNDIKTFSAFNASSANVANVANISNNSLTSNSDFSYTKNIKTHKTPNIQPLNINKNIRAGKTKNKKKITNLDEIDYLYNKLQDYIRNTIIDKSNYIILIVKAMEIIENYNIVNNTKKEIVIKALNRIVLIDLNLDDFCQRLFLSSINNIIELIINNTNSKGTTNDKKNFNNKNDKFDDIILANCGQIIYSIIDKLTTIVLKKQYTADKLFTNIATLTDILMILVDKYNYLTGTEKKMIVLQAIDTFINKKLEFIIELSNDTKNDLIDALDSVPLIVDLFIAIQKGKYKINKQQTLIVNKNSWCKSLFKSKEFHE